MENKAHKISNSFTDFLQSDKNNNIFYKIFKHSVIPIIIHDLDMHILDINDSALHEFGYTKEEILKKSIFDLHDESELEHSAKVRDTMQKVEKLSVETSFKRKDGTTFYAMATPCKYLFEDKEIVHVTIQNITEQKNTLNELRKSESWLKHILEILPVGVWITDKNGVIIHGNETGKNIWEGALYVGIDEFHQYKAWWYSTKELIKQEDWAVARAIKYGESSFKEEIEIECFDGSHKIIFNWALPIFDENNQFEGVVALNQDITESKKAER
ncbi:MAG: PAS domain S-box protein [Leptospiraceae bacterium]|nr:PAS domain-containing protein [Leptospiraceae bacterium]MCP5499160.1 PAS domain S-box protein [Leptospiraceae bacterium]